MIVCNVLGQTKIKINELCKISKKAIGKCMKLLQIFFISLLPEHCTVTSIRETKILLEEAEWVCRKPSAADSLHLEYIYRTNGSSSRELLCLRT